ncbi:histidine kinase [Shewanella mangrovi]|uniref:Histidine kinase n=1 Tax=Shewanella mangrovi TaxID=1515746 RepID=A0A094JEH0_9GAMM|nr:Bax inhibitor-1 family protein [Shewanella mangrovi]KFZ37647.1 histidine kinase [Shewanella mangrovi]
MENTVFDRRDTNDKVIGSQLYNLIIGLTLLWGFAINYLMVQTIDPSIIISVPPLLFFGGYFVCCFIGIAMFSKSDSPVVSFIGYNLVVIPFGLVINVVVSGYDPMLVVEAMRITTLVTLGMMVLGTLFPAFFAKIGRALFISLLVVIVVELVEMFIFNVHHSILDWVVAVIFCGYIGYDWGRANMIPKTVDNAIDSAAALYMDIINLFLRILRILGSRR